MDISVKMKTSSAVNVRINRNQVLEKIQNFNTESRDSQRGKKMESHFREVATFLTTLPRPAWNMYGADGGGDNYKHIFILLLCSY